MRIRYCILKNYCLSKIRFFPIVLLLLVAHHGFAEWGNDFLKKEQNIQLLIEFDQHRQQGFIFTKTAKRSKSNYSGSRFLKKTIYSKRNFSKVDFISIYNDFRSFFLSSKKQSKITPYCSQKIYVIVFLGKVKKVSDEVCLDFMNDPQRDIFIRWSNNVDQLLK